jgi:glutathione S-transferase
VLDAYSCAHMVERTGGAMALEYYTNPMSRGMIGHWMLEEVGQPYETTWLAWGPTGNKSPEYLKINPMGKVPTLIHDGRVVTEAAAVCIYLAEAFPQASLKPSIEHLADYYRWTMFCAGPVEQAVTSKAMGWQVAAERKGMVGFGSYDETVSALEGMLKTRDFVCGKHFTAADVYVGSTVGWGVNFGTLPKLPALVAYNERMVTRPAHQRVQQLCAAKAAELKAAQ